MATGAETGAGAGTEAGAGSEAETGTETVAETGTVRCGVVWPSSPSPHHPARAAARPRLTCVSGLLEPDTGPVTRLGSEVTPCCLLLQLTPAAGRLTSAAVGPF